MNRFLIGGLAVAAILAGGLGFYASTLEKPTYGVVDRGDWKNVSEESITINSTAWINNPNSVGFSLGFVDLSYSAAANNVTVASGDVSGLGIPSGNSTVDLETTVSQGKIPVVWVNHLKNGGKTTLSVPATIKLPFRSFTTTVFSKTVKTDIPEKIGNSLNSIEGTYTGPRVSVEKIGTTVEARPELKVKDFKASWGNVSINRTELLVDVTVKNPNLYPVPVPEFGGTAKLNSITVADWRANAQPLTTLPENGVILPGEQERLRFTVDIKNQKMDEWLESHVKKHEYTDVDVKTYLIFGFDQQEFRVPPGGLKCDMSIQTSILVDDQKTSFEQKGCNSIIEGYSSSDSNDSSFGEEDLVNDNTTDLENSTQTNSSSDELLGSGIVG